MGMLQQELERTQAATVPICGVETEAVAFPARRMNI
jgi:hypothetical protein